MFSSHVWKWFLSTSKKKKCFYALWVKFLSLQSHSIWYTLSDFPYVFVSQFSRLWEGISKFLFTHVQLIYQIDLRKLVFILSRCIFSTINMLIFFQLIACAFIAFNLLVFVGYRFYSIYYIELLEVRRNCSFIVIPVDLENFRHLIRSSGGMSCFIKYRTYTNTSMREEERKGKQKAFGNWNSRTLTMVAAMVMALDEFSMLQSTANVHRPHNNAITIESM